jgi:hypothetical protein
MVSCRNKKLYTEQLLLTAWTWVKLQADDAVHAAALMPDYQQHDKHTAQRVSLARSQAQGSQHLACGYAASPLPVQLAA